MSWSDCQCSVCVPVFTIKSDAVSFSLNLLYLDYCIVTHFTRWITWIVNHYCSMTLCYLFLSFGAQRRRVLQPLRTVKIWAFHPAINECWLDLRTNAMQIILTLIWMGQRTPLCTNVTNYPTWFSKVKRYNQNYNWAMTLKNEIS